ncbi:MAG: DUF2489 domain-containing protein [Oligoflexia bacterium]|nr:DUF2489 domain-containing protein [Oligoflexia bacterium]
MNAWLNENASWLWPVIGLLIFSLSIVIGFLYSSLKTNERVSLKNKLDEKHEKAKAFEQQQEKTKFINESLRTITLACIQNQCEISEGCIRIKHLLQSSPDLMTGGHDWSVFFEFESKLRKFATHEKRNELSSQEAFNEDKERFELEKEYHEKFIKSCKNLYEILKSQSIHSKQDQLH